MNIEQHMKYSTDSRLKIYTSLKVAISDGELMLKSNINWTFPIAYSEPQTAPHSGR